MSVLAEAVAVERNRRAETRPSDVEAAHVADEQVTERDLLNACRRAVDVACRRLSHDEREDMTSELVAAVASKHGWTPARRTIRHGYLTRRAAYLWARQRERLIAGRSDALPSVLDETRQRGAVPMSTEGMPDAADHDRPGAPARSLLAVAADMAGHPPVAAENVDVPNVTAALGLTATAADKVRAALSGWGSALDLARALNVSHASARKRLQRGGDAIRARYPDPAAFLDALGATLADAPDPERQAERVRLTAAERAASDAVTAVSRSGRAYRRAANDPAVTIRATRRNLRAARLTGRYGAPIAHVRASGGTGGRQWIGAPDAPRTCHVASVAALVHARRAAEAWAHRAAEAERHGGGYCLAA